MVALLRFVVRWGVLLALLPGIFGLWALLWERLPHALEHRELAEAIATILLGWGLHRFLRRGNGRLADFISFLDTLEHELTHGIVALLFLHPPSTLHVTERKGGHIRLKQSNWMISLAPYLLPLWTAIAALLMLIVEEDLVSIFLTITLFLYGIFLSRLMSELHPKQTDLRESGLFHSYLVVALFHLLLLPTMIFLAAGVIGWREYFSSFFDYYPLFFEMVKKALHAKGIG